MTDFTISCCIETFFNRKTIVYAAWYGNSKVQKDTIFQQYGGLGWTSRKVLGQFENYLRYEEKADATINKYLHDVGEMVAYIGNSELNKDMLIQYRQDISRKCKAQTVNGKLSAINAFLNKFRGDSIKLLKVQTNCI